MTHNYDFWKTATPWDDGKDDEREIEIERVMLQLEASVKDSTLFDVLKRTENLNLLRDAIEAAATEIVDNDVSYEEQF